jgi:hypothetical protein
MPVDTTSPPPCPVSPVKISPSAMSPPPLRRKFPCPTTPRADVLLGYPHELLSQVAVPGSLPVCTVRKCQFRHPVRPGDTIRVNAEVIELRPTRQPDRGVIVWNLETVNQDTEIVLTMTLSALIGRRQ